MLRTKAVKWQYDRLLTEQFINGLNENGMINEIPEEVAILEDIDDATSEHVLLWDIG